MNDKVSTIVPVFNTENYLHRCIESILNQTYRDIELVLVDDGSQDRSGLICDEYAKKDKRVKVIHKPNGSIGSAYNAAFRILTGNYVCFVDSDDYVANNMVENLLRVLKTRDADMVRAGRYILNSEGKVVAMDRNADGELQQRENILYWYFKKPRRRGLAPALYRTELFSGFRFLEQNPFIDSLVTPQILWKCNKVVNISECCYYGCRRPDSAAGAKMTLTKFNQKISLLNKLVEFGQSTHNKRVEKFILFTFLRFLKNEYTNLPNYNCSIKEKAEIKRAIKKYFELYYTLYLRNDESLAISRITDYSLWLFRRFPLTHGFLITQIAKCKRTARNMAHKMFKVLPFTYSIYKMVRRINRDLP